MNHPVKILFGRSRSVQLFSVVENCRQFDGFNDLGNEYQILLTYKEIFEEWERFHSIYIIIAKWTSFKLFIDEKLIDNEKAWRFYYEMQNIKDCYKEYLIFKNLKRHCCNSSWKCQKLKAIKMNPLEYGTFWYQFGHFNKDKTRWILHKNELIYYLKLDINKTKAFCCPSFNESRVLEVVDNLPNEIDLTDNATWLIKTEKRFVGDTIEDVPVGIYHIIEEDNDNGIVFKIELGLREEDLTPNEEMINPYDEGTDDWANWEIENYQTNKKKQ